LRLMRMMTSVLAGGLCLTGSLISRADTAKGDATGAHAAPKTSKGHKPGADVHKSDQETSVAADNTGTNKRDRDSSEKTADQQKNDKSDVEVAAEIRRSIVKDDTLSTNAHNVKIVVQDGTVTLKGPVASKVEKSTVEKKASEVAGRRKVVNELAVAP
jgi:hyperosmotically inducible protein